jgi:hypothetical protein
MSFESDRSGYAGWISRHIEGPSPDNGNEVQGPPEWGESSWPQSDGSLFRVEANEHTLRADPSDAAFLRPSMSMPFRTPHSIRLGSRKTWRRATRSRSSSPHGKAAALLSMALRATSSALRSGRWSLKDGMTWFWAAGRWACRSKYRKLKLLSSRGRGSSGRTSEHSEDDSGRSFQYRVHKTRLSTTLVGRIPEDWIIEEDPGGDIMMETTMAASGIA